MNYYKYATLFDYNKDVFTVYNFDNKIRCGDNEEGCVIGDLDTYYNCFINAGPSYNNEYYNNKFCIDFINKYNIDENNCFIFDKKIEDLPEKLNYLIEKYNNIFIKIDVEGKEWSWLLSLDYEYLDKITQLVIDFRGINNSSLHNDSTMNHFNCSSDEKYICLEKLENTHYLIHAHGNNTDSVSYNGMPNIIQLVYVNKNIFNKIPELNKQSLPLIGLDFPNNRESIDIDLNFFPFVNNIKENPFLIDIEDKDEYNIEDYINIQKQLNDKIINKNIDNIIETLYTSQNSFYKLEDFKSRISRGLTQKLFDMNNNLLPIKNLYKIGNGGDGKNCFICCTPFSSKINGEGNESRFIASQQILKSLEEVNFNGYFYLFNGGFPNPTGIEMKYVGVPYCFKIFMMLEAEKIGFTKVIWIDSGCYALNNPEYLFDILCENNIIGETYKSNNNYKGMVLQKTTILLNQITKCNLHNATYFQTVVFGLNLESNIIKNLIKEYYEMVKLGWPFFSIFPEEIVLSSLLNKSEYKKLNLSNNINSKLRIDERLINEHNAKNNGFYFHHKDYSKYKNQ